MWGDISSAYTINIGSCLVSIILFSYDAHKPIVCTTQMMDKVFLFLFWEIPHIAISCQIVARVHCETYSFNYRLVQHMTGRVVVMVCRFDLPYFLLHQKFKIINNSTIFNKVLKCLVLVLHNCINIEITILMCNYLSFSTFSFMYYR